MKVIICGGRDYAMTFADALMLCRAHGEFGFTEVVSGACRGADSCGEAWANCMGIPVRTFPADWQKNGKAAGFMRNETMAKYADCVMAFPGGNGTADMVSRAEKYGLQSVNKWLGEHGKYSF